ncbi:DNA polymerase III subunit delta [Phormidium sp. CLA17]|uniref:DNA polymerase III subunit delta n=1 Tax=Leptolyngbya sp. Cla-17 TaxID=2803751 RepID=UPI0014912E67|nr:DNA polymerase III subunit delta [Leptolyngbya sp. Cla-17]MBM0741984.1 DNA polymerase III subunit delta [Leptolyngbya sp. Cla-17]
MPIYLYWGTDDFAIAQATKALRLKVLDPAWESFNYNRISPEQSDAVTQGLNQAMTPPFGAGSRLTWLTDTTVCQRCPDELFGELERTFASLPDTSILLLTSSVKPDSRLKVTKLLQKYAEIREFSPIPSWKGDLLLKQVKQVAQEMSVRLTAEAEELLAESVGNDTRQLYSALEKLQLYAGNERRSLTESDVATLVVATQQNALKLAAAIRQGQVAEALEMVAELLRQNEPALGMVSSLIKQFRCWLWIKLMLESGERDDAAIAKAAEIANPKRLYFLRQEVQPLSSQALLQTLPLLLELEFSLKDGAEDLAAMQTKIVELCHLCGMK